MKTGKKNLICLLAVLLGGCVPSLHKLYTEDVVVFEEKLLGMWANDEEKWQFEREESETVYAVTIIDKEKRVGEFVGYLVKLDEMLFLDLYPEDLPEEMNDYYEIHLLGVHTFMKVEKIESKLVMRMMNPDTIKKMLEKKPELIKHEMIDDRVVLTAGPRELQKLLKEHANDEDFFGDAGELDRYVLDDDDDDEHDDDDNDDDEEHEDDEDDDEDDD